MKAQIIILLTLACAPALADKAAIETNTNSAANPIRKVVTMLQMMMNKIEAEGKKEQELYDKFMCYCQTGEETLSKAITDAETKIPQLESDIKSAVAEKAQLEVELKQAQVDRDAAKVAEDKATGIREKEAKAYAAFKAEADSNIDALMKAIAAIEKGMTGGFLQTNAAAVLRGLTLGKVNMLDFDRQELVAFLSGTGSQRSGYAPASGEIVGILKQLLDEMNKDLAEATAAENEAIKIYEELMAAKKKEMDALTGSIEEHLKRIGELGVQIVTLKNDLEDTNEGLSEDTKFRISLGVTCDTKKKDWDLRVKTRQEELLALADTIKILNDDDALELFKKTLPSASLLQLEVSAAALRKKALGMIKQAAQAKNVGNSLPLDFISLALQGKQAGFEKVIKLIDEMVVTLAKEQQDDDHKKEYCEKEFDIADDKKKALERSIDDADKAITETGESLTTVKEEIAGLEDGIKALDKSVLEATEQRKEENADHTEFMAGNTAAKELILFAKNRMQKFYNPKLYKPPPKRELTEEERITLNMGGTLAPTNPPGGIAGTGVAMSQIRAHNADAPPPPPETFGAYEKKSEESGGVLAMMDLLVKELDKEMQEGEIEEKDAQKDYEKYMTESSMKRADMSKSLTDKESAKAELEKFLQATTDTKKADETEKLNVVEYIGTLHNECDFLLQYYQVRKDARAGEVDALKKAKAVLSGADFSFLQKGNDLRATK